MDWRIEIILHWKHLHHFYQKGKFKSQIYDKTKPAFYSAIIHFKKENLHFYDNHNWSIWLGNWLEDLLNLRDWSAEILTPWVPTSSSIIWVNWRKDIDAASPKCHHWVPPSYLMMLLGKPWWEKIRIEMCMAPEISRSFR